MKKLTAQFQTFKLTAKILTAALSLILENIVSSFWWAFAWLALFICIWLTGYSSYTSSVVFWVGFIGSIVWGIKQFSLPLYEEAVLLVEKTSKLKHRPLQSLTDNKITRGREEFWILEKARQKTLIASLKFSFPHFDLPKRDPYALRVAFCLILFCAFFLSPQSSLQKIRTGLFPPSATSGDATASIPFAQIRITPPAYSGLKTQLINQSSNDPIDILSGSLISAEVHTTHGTPVLKMGKLKIAFKKTQDTWTAETLLQQTAKSITVSIYGWPRFHQDIHFIIDRPPSLSWNGPIEILPSGEMRIPLKVEDDFGLKKLTLRGILTPDEKVPFFGSPLAIEKNQMIVLSQTSANINTVFDATGHPWAGLKVSLMVEAEDFAGNISQTQPLEMVLPQRNFHNPVARTLASIRSDLLALRGNADSIAGSIEEILFRPELYKWDITTTLGLRSVDSRLHYSRDKSDLESIAGILWSLAMHLEDGRISESQLSLKDAVSKLQEAIQNGASKAEIADLMQKMQQALLQHLQAIAQKIQQKNDGKPQMTMAINTKSLSDFLQKLQNAVLNGDKASALQKLNEMQQLTDMMGSSMGEGVPKDVQAMMDNIQSMQNIMQRQKKLLDRTRQAGAQDLKSQKQEQSSIEDSTKNLADKAKNAKDLQDAAQEMSSSGTALDHADSMASIDHQQKALDLLQKGSKSMQEKLQQKLQNMMGLAMGQSSGSQDPLGQSTQIRDDGTEIPGTASRKKTDQILKTLRDREGDMNRPSEERSYYQRLLKQW